MNSLDSTLSALDNTLRTLFAEPRANQPCPQALTVDEEVNGQPVALTAAEKAHAGALMRVNHVGEVCAQALYTAAAMATKNAATRKHFVTAAREEMDHLAWTKSRLNDLNARPSLLNPLWYAGAFGLGLLAGRLGDPVSYAFVNETEKQVEAHLHSHLDKLPAGDHTSRAIVSQMQIDEARHGAQARAAGAPPLPAPVQALMAAAARVMTTTAHYV